MYHRGTSNQTAPAAFDNRTRESSPSVPAPHVYDLRVDADSSDAFFPDVAQFAAECVARIESRSGVLLDGYTAHLRDVLAESPRSRAEYALEFLTIGMALRRYEAAAALAPPWAVRLGAILVSLRQRLPRLKPAIDKARAMLSDLWIDRTLLSSTQPEASWPAAPSQRLTRLIAWLHATGEFEQEALRLANWRSYLAQLPQLKSAYWLTVSARLFDQFAQDAARRLGPYTRGVEPFLNGDYAHRGLREDRLFCGRPPAEYHLNMVAAEVMNQGLRESFDRTTRKVLLLPACMRGAKAAQCRAHVKGTDIVCAACDPACAINRITRRMRALGVRTYIVPHSTGFSRWLTRWQREPNVGVTAVACLLNILPGGYEMRARGIASQCLPLDFPGCRKHWDRRGVSTAVHEDRLVQIVTGKSPTDITDVPPSPRAPS